MATKQTKPAAKAAAKPAAAPAPAPVEQEAEGVELEVGQSVKFLGYDENTPAEDQLLEADGVYEIVGFTEADEANGDPGGDPIVQIENPNFDKKKKEHPETNPR